MQEKVLNSLFGQGYDVRHETVDGRQVLKVRCYDHQAGMWVTLTFPASGGADDMERFKNRLVKSVLHRIARRTAPA